MRVENVQYPKVVRRQSMGQAMLQSPREVVFRIVDENGYHVVNPGKKFPFTLSNIVWANGTPIETGILKGTALSEAESPSSSVVRVTVQVPNNPNDYALQDQPVDATLNLYGVNGGVTYPIFANKRLRFTVPPASAFPLDLQTVYASYDADKYAADTAAQDEIMAQKYASMLVTEAEAQAAADKAKAAAADAAAKKAAADDAIAAALNEQTSRNKKLMWAIGGLAALGLVGYLALHD